MISVAAQIFELGWRGKVVNA